MTKKITHVAAGVLIKPSGEYLLASRPQGKPWAGWWEFPGGKIEMGETPEHALIRELKEELGIAPTHIQPWIQRVYNYPETHDSPAKTVHLHFHFVTEWNDELTPHEGQDFCWQNPQNISVSPVLPANAPIMKALALPPVYMISNVAEMGEAAFLHALEAACNKGCRLIQIREKQMGLTDLKRFSQQVLVIAKSYGAKVLISESIDLACQLGADGVHLPSAALLELQQKPKGLMVAASCHNAAELAQAQKLELDFVVLSPVNSTKSHLDAKILGWQEFARLIEKIEIPVYALGGMALEDLPKALSCGARGIAMQRAAWGNEKAEMLIRLLSPAL